VTQNPVKIPITAPLSGLALIADINAAFDSISRLFSGTTAPTAIGLGLSGLSGVLWHDLSTNALWLRDQADATWIALGNVDETNKVFVSAGSLANIAALRAQTTTAPVIVLRGATSAGDGGEGSFVRGATGPADNGGTIIVTANGTYYRLRLSAPVTPQWFGAAGDGVTDDTVAVQAALNYAAANALPLSLPCVYAVSTVQISNVNGLTITGGGLIGIDTVNPHQGVLDIMGSSSLKIIGLGVNANYHTNYASAIRVRPTTGACQYIDFISCNLNYAVHGFLIGDGSPTVPLGNAVVSEINIIGGYTFGTLICCAAYGSETVVNVQAADWQSMAAGYPTVTAWVNGPTYTLGQFAGDTGGTYQLTVSTSTGDQPSTTPSKWALVSRWPAPSAYAPGTTYGVGRVVTYNNNTYISLQSSNIGNTPTMLSPWTSGALGPCGPWQSAMAVLRAVGARINFSGGEINGQNLAGAQACLEIAPQAISEPNGLVVNPYGSIYVSGGTNIEAGGKIAQTINPSALTGQVGGASSGTICILGCSGFQFNSQSGIVDPAPAIATDALHRGNIKLDKNSFYAPTGSRTGVYDISCASSLTRVNIGDETSFVAGGFLSGLNGVTGGTLQFGHRMIFDANNANGQSLPNAATTTLKMISVNTAGDLSRFSPAYSSTTGIWTSPQSMSNVTIYVSLVKSGLSGAINLTVGGAFYAAAPITQSCGQLSYSFSAIAAGTTVSISVDNESGGTVSLNASYVDRFQIFATA